MIKYDPARNQEMCKCGHKYWRHFNLKTKEHRGCFFSYNCDCEKFESRVQSQGRKFAEEVYAALCNHKWVPDR